MSYDKEKGMFAIATDYADGGYVFEKMDSYIAVETFNVTPDIVQETDSYRNANGKLKRPSIMPYVASKIEFNTSHVVGEKMDELMSLIDKAVNAGEAISEENKLRIRFYNPKTRKYKQAWAYYPDITFGVYTVAMGYPIYTPTRFAFITYGEKR